MHLYEHVFIVSGHSVTVNVLCGISRIQTQPCPGHSFLSATISHLLFSTPSKHLCFFKRIKKQAGLKFLV